MSLLDYTTLTLGDICREALFEAGVVGQGMTASASEVTRAWSRAQFILEQWERRRWMIYSLQRHVIPSSGGQSYTVGMNGEFDLGVNDYNSDYNNDFGTGNPVNRPARLEGVFFRQQQGGLGAGAPLSGLPTVVPGATPSQNITTPAVPGPAYIDYPLQQIEAPEDYWTQVRLKSLLAWPEFAYYEASWPLGKLWLYPAVPLSQQYYVGIVCRALLPSRSATLNSLLVLPPEYHSALLYSTALAIRSAYQIPSFPGDQLPQREAEALRVIRKSNVRVPRNLLGREWTSGRGRYNIFSDQIT